MGNVVSHFIAPLKVHFKVPESAEDDPMAFFEDMRADLSRFDDGTLKAAAATIRQTRDATIYFPSVAECIRVCKDTESAEIAKRPLNGERKTGLGADYAVRRANRLIQSDLGRQAASEGWITWLWEYCCEHGELPKDQSQIRKMVSAHSLLESEWEQLSSSGKAVSSMVIARKSLLGRRKHLSEIANSARG